MESKVILKVIITMLIILFTVSMFTNFVYAQEAGNGNFDLSGFEGNADSSIKEPITNIVGTILSVMRIICTGIAIIMIIVIAMKYMLAAPGERADLKKSSVQFVVGALILFGSSGIISIIETAVNNVINTEQGG